MLCRAMQDRQVTVMSSDKTWSTGGGNGKPLQYSCLEHFMDRGAWWATVNGFTKNQTRLSDLAHTFTLEIVSEFRGPSGFSRKDF